MKTYLIQPTLFLAIFSMFFFSSCRATKDSTKLTEMTIENPAAGNNLFAFDLFRKVINDNQENIIISPFSISTALAMTYAGASGQTAEEIAHTLYFHHDQEKFHPEFSAWLREIISTAGRNDRLSIANSLWPQKDFHFLPEFFELIENYYESALYEVDFKGDREQIRNQINDWVSAKTNGLIEELIKPGILVEDTRLVLVNAIYFLANWKIAFDKNNTHDNIFTLSDGQTVTAPFMTLRDHFQYFENESMQMIELLYEGEDLSMIIVMPLHGKDLQEFLNDFSMKELHNSIGQFNMEEVEVYLPSFRVRSEFDLEEIMAAMGMPLAFTNKADFSRMTEENDLKIDKIIHQAFIDVTEEGTEAAASTAVVMIRKTAISQPPSWKTFRADRPFFYFIRNNTDDTILFMGQVADPTLKD